jgi:ABC-type glycerol-3-phosphate transport system substrate-binding protein
MGINKRAFEAKHESENEDSPTDEERVHAGRSRDSLSEGKSKNQSVLIDHETAVPQRRCLRHLGMAVGVCASKLVLQASIGFLVTRHHHMRATTWIWFALITVALLTTGHRLALPGSSPGLLRFAHTFTTESERAILNAAIAEFEQTHPGVRIEQIISNSEVYNTVGWRLQFQGRKQPDIFFHWQGFKVEQCVERGWAMDVSPYLTPGFLNQFVATAIQTQRAGIYFLPHSADLSALVWFNADLFKARGVSEPRTFEEWLRLCRKVREAKILPLAQGNRDLWPLGNFAAELEGQALGAPGAGRPFEPGVRISSNDIRGLRPLVELVKAGAFDLPSVLDPGSIGQLSDIDAKVLFLSGKPAQHILGSWFVADIQDARNKGELKFSVGVFAVPPAAGETDALCAVTTGFLVNPHSKNPKGAVAFLELLLSRKYQSEFAKLGTLSVRRDALEFTQDPLGKQMLEILGSTSVLVPPPDTGYAPEQAAVFYELVGKLLTGRLELNQAALWWQYEKQHLARKGL